MQIQILVLLKLYCNFLTESWIVCYEKRIWQLGSYKQKTMLPLVVCFGLKFIICFCHCILIFFKRIHALEHICSFSRLRIPNKKVTIEMIIHIPKTICLLVTYKQYIKYISKLLGHLSNLFKQTEIFGFKFFNIDWQSPCFWIKIKLILKSFFH